MDGSRMNESIDHNPTSILRNVYKNEIVEGHSPNRITVGSMMNRHRVGVSPVRVKRSMNESVPMAVVTPSPPIVISTKRLDDVPRAISTKLNGDCGFNRFVSLRAVQTEFRSNGVVSTSSPFEPSFNSGTPLSRRSRSSFGSMGLGLFSRKLEYDEQVRQSDCFNRSSLVDDDVDVDSQVPSNSILTLHSLDDGQNDLHSSPEDPNMQRLKQLEGKLRELEVRLANTIAAHRSDATKEPAASGSKSQTPLLIDLATPATPGSKCQTPLLIDLTTPTVTPISTPSQTSVGKGRRSFGTVSVAVSPMMALDGGIYRVQPSSGSEVKSQRDLERMEKKLKQQEEATETLRAQYVRQIEQLTRQLASNDDVTQTLRSRIRELELENELWQNRFRLYNDVDVAKILRENERLRSRQRKRSEDGNELLRMKEEIEAQAVLRAGYNNLDQKYQTLKEKYKEMVKAYRTRHRQDHIELESLKVAMQLQDAELSMVRERELQLASVASEAQQAAVSNADTSTNNAYIDYNLAKCHGIAECLSKICAHLKQKEPLDPAEVLDYGSPAGAKSRLGQRNAATADNGKTLEETVDGLADKLMKLHTLVVDLYGDDLANSVDCSIQ